MCAAGSGKLMACAVEVVVRHVRIVGRRRVHDEPERGSDERRGRPAVDVMRQCEPGGDVDVGRVDLDGLQCALAPHQGGEHPSSAVSVLDTADVARRGPRRDTEGLADLLEAEALAAELEDARDGVDRERRAQIPAPAGHPAGVSALPGPPATASCAGRPRPGALGGALHSAEFPVPAASTGGRVDGARGRVGLHEGSIVLRRRPRLCAYAPYSGRSG